MSLDTSQSTGWLTEPGIVVVQMLLDKTADAEDDVNTSLRLLEEKGADRLLEQSPLLTDFDLKTRAPVRRWWTPQREEAQP